MESRDASIRLAAFARLEQLSLEFNSRIPHEQLIRGFDFEGERVPLISPSRGIFIPKILARSAGTPLPLSFNTTPPKPNRPRPYRDEWGTDGLLRYKYFKSDPAHRDNVGMRAAMTSQVPLIYLEGQMGGGYRADWPVFVVGDNPSSLTFEVSTEDRQLLPEPASYPQEQELRDYRERTVAQRQHQRTFRRRVLAAYAGSCCVCRLRHERLLDAAHIIADSDPRGEPWVHNGLSLCKIHHAAYDENILGISPQGVVRVREDILREIDGPMLTYGIQQLHGQPLAVLPDADHLRPKREFLEERFRSFLSAPPRAPS